MLKDIEKLAYNRLESVSKIKQYTCLLIKNQSNYKGLGSGVFVKIDNLYLLISAAHVFDDLEDLFIILDGGKHLLKPGGQIIKNTPQLSRDFDHLDIGVLILDKKSIEDITSNYSFLDQTNIQINHLLDYEKNYLIFGYPSTWSKKSMSRNSFHTRPFISFTNSIMKDEYNKFKRSTFLNIILNYDRESTINLKSGTLSYGPNLYGISGCGLWHLDKTSINRHPKLVGIMTDWLIENRKKVIATRIDIITEMLIREFDVDLPNTNLFGYI